ncbi:MAG: ATP synthase F1 subunit gamma [Crocinitomicaceae bacterium]|nr:ATP synthase F1 subunit gamma [Crocinitomicaceae bacterium]|tara:strand:+ start:2770 stop:3642 length:873 start_codon:yes stop_codon:yes gene_type:complete
MAGGLKEVRERIGSVQNTMQITSAMKMVSAAKLRRAQDAITRMRPYAEKIQTILANVSATLDSSEGVFSQERNVKTALVVCITSDRGLCGAFNNNNIKIAKEIIRENEEKGIKTFVLPLGKKSSEAFIGNRPEGFELVAIFADLNFDVSSEVAEFVMNGYLKGDWDSVKIAYSKFKNAAVQIPTKEKFLPLLPEEVEEEASSNQVEYIFEPNREEIVENIIPSALKIQLYKALLDSHASEHGARMTAMHSATENAGELLNELKISYNKARQASITTEILEIVAGSEALEG